MLVLGVDIGGTKIASGLVNERAEIQKTALVPTLASEGFDVSLKQVFVAIDTCITRDMAAIGICAPGPLNPKTGVVLNPPNLPGWRDIPLAKIVAEKYGLPCNVENDANAAGLAEVLFGAAQGCESVVYVTLSTGIGAGIILNRKIYHGKNGFAAEGGHVTIDYRSEHVCICGTPGCIEALASGSALAARGLNPHSLTQSQLDELCTMIAAWLGGIVSLLDPDIIVIGGGISQIGGPLFSRLRAEVPRRTINQFASLIPIVPSGLAGNSGVLGAASVALEIKSKP
jgi:glucokinase